MGVFSMNGGWDYTISPFLSSSRCDPASRWTTSAHSLLLGCHAKTWNKGPDPAVLNAKGEAEDVGL